MKKILVLITAMILVVTFNVIAQESYLNYPDNGSRRRSSMKDNDSIKDNFKHSIGFAAGFTTGYGLSYRYWPKKIGIQTTFAPYNTADVSVYSAGLTCLQELAETDVAVVFMYESVHFYYRQEFHNGSFYSSYYDDDTKGPIRRQINSGFGAGVEFKMGKRVVYDLMIGYAGYNGFKRVNLTAETGLYFKF